MGNNWVCNLNLALTDFRAHEPQPAAKKETTYRQYPETIFGPFIQHSVSARMMALTSTKHLLHASSMVVPGLGTLPYFISSFPNNLERIIPA